MFARIVTIHIQPGKMDEVLGIFRASIQPVARQQKGYRGGYLLTDRKASKVVSVGLWETEADMAASESSGYLGEQVAKILPAVAAPPVTDHYEVSSE